MSISGSQTKRNITIGSVIVALLIGSLWFPSANAFPLWGNLLGTALFSLAGAAWCLVNLRYPHWLAWMQDEQRVERIMQTVVVVAFPFLLGGLDFLFWAALQRQVSHTTLLAGMAAINLALLTRWFLGLRFPSLTERGGIPFVAACLLATAVFAAWLAYPALVALICTVIAVFAYAAFLAWYRRWEARQAELFDYDEPIVVENLDERTVAFLQGIAGVTINTLGPHSHTISLATPDTEWNVVSEPGGRETWLFYYSDEQVLGCDIGGGLPTRLWAATAQMWEAASAFAFAQARYTHELELGVISPDTPPPDPAAYAD